VRLYLPNKALHRDAGQTLGPILVFDFIMFFFRVVRRLSCPARVSF
jgi:hypothetical protein